MAASEALAIDVLTEADVASGMVLSTEAGWNQTDDDWRHFIVEGATIGVRDQNGRLIASAAALPYDGPFGYVGMVLVTADWRRKGIATRLVDRCIDELRGRGLVPVLDATAAGAEVYRHQGFVGQFGFDRWEGVCEPSNREEQDDPADGIDVEALDMRAFGARRGALLRDFMARPETKIVSDADGFAMIRTGRRALQAGPVVAKDETSALEFIERLLAGVRGPLFIDVPDRWRRIADWLRARGFQVQRSFTRMALGRAEPFGDPARLFAVAGPEFG